MAKRPPSLKPFGITPPRKWADKRRGTASERGYGAGWAALRKQVMARDKRLCQPCLKLGIARPAREVDHVQPKHLGGTDELGNLQAICSPCHKLKTAREGRSARGS